MAVPREVEFDLVRNLWVTDYVTLCNGTSLQRSFITAHVFIYLGYEFDRWDGVVAKWRNECSEMGKQLDSLSDLIKFGVAPTIMLYSIGFRTPVDQVVLIFYVVCGVSRLARFNITADLIPKDAHGKALYYEGIIIPYAALGVSTAVAVCAWMDWTSEYVLFQAFFRATWCEFHPAIVPVIAVGTSMVSKRLKPPAVGTFVIPAMTVVVFASCWSLSPPQL
ncbi:uncharacterized protein K460DRAFT_26961 [Cucurbitaria berberidis CBS 394.84]|uniref:CDP-diacylglycerol--serine O-phosphatidyltransferase n=1 Tax=Cucurbitaria berberidis CBS 394.84 TaxID=1168544 RepID=A0A9P4GR33_9PLEO|nr:uncharacterized protein K460DRAFT_26961 [Cucurbitaria berberidis CBS 394.84]KAF1851053.1 hypothetical protein K460DRAFT_26961 [Cucurbitaria berberidis CBS 394.84]